MAYQAVIFDLDGTLLNTLEDLAASTNAALAAFALPRRTVDQVRRMVGNGLGKLIQRAVPAGTPEETQAAVLAAMKAHYALHALDRTALYPWCSPAWRQPGSPAPWSPTRRISGFRPSTTGFSKGWSGSPSANGRDIPGSRIRRWFAWP